MSNKKNIAIVGAGLVGSILACYLSKRGHSVRIFERRPDMRRAGYIGGKSINLALSDRGWKSLEQIGLAEAVRKIALPMKGRLIHNLDGSTQLIPYGKENQAIYSVSRGEINRLMVEEAEKFPDVKFYFNQRCEHIDFNENTIEFQNTIEEKSTRIQADIIFGADGAFSEVRYEMQITPNFNISQQHEAFGYKELNIPPGPDGKHQIAHDALHIWPRGTYMMIALPNIDGSFTLTLFAPFKGENGFDHIQTEADVMNYFNRNFPDAVPLMPSLKTDFFENPTASLVTIKCFPWKHKNACLIGDAAHAIVPFYGQGMICGFEDARELNDILDATGEDWELSLDTFQHQRKPNADAIADLALHNYIEMRDLSGRADFQLRLKIEKFIAEKFGERFMTHYSMVVFSNLPYSVAKAKGEKQNELLDQIMALPNIEERWNSDEVLQLADDWIKKNS